MARPRTEELKIRHILLKAKPSSLSWKQVQQQTRLPKSTVTTILHRMLQEKNAIATLEYRHGRPTPVYRYEPHPHWVESKMSAKDQRTQTNIMMGEHGKVTDVEVVGTYERLAPKANLGGLMYSEVKRRVKVPKERWNIEQ